MAADVELLTPTAEMPTGGGRCALGGGRCCFGHLRLVRLPGDQGAGRFTHPGEREG